MPDGVGRLRLAGGVAGGDLLPGEVPAARADVLQEPRLVARADEDAGDGRPLELNVMAPTRPWPTSSARRLKPLRQAVPEPLWPRSSFMTSTRSAGQPGATARSLRAYCRRSASPRGRRRRLAILKSSVFTLVTAPASALPAPVPALPAPGPALPAPVPALPAPVPALPAPGPALPAPVPALPAPAPALPAPMPALPAPMPALPAPAPALPAPAPALPAPAPALPAPGPAIPAPAPAFPAPGPALPAPGPAFPAPGPAFPAPGPALPAPGPALPAPGPALPAPVRLFFASARSSGTFL